MGETIKGNKVLAGTWAEVYWNGFKIAELEKIEAKVTVNREDVQMGLDVDTKVTGLKGEGTLALKKVYTRFDGVRREMTKGRDPRGSIVAKLKDPDAVGGQTERYQIGNVALGEFAKTWEMGAVVKEEYPFTFTPTDMILLDQIKDI